MKLILSTLRVLLKVNGWLKLLALKNIASMFVTLSVWNVQGWLHLTAQLNIDSREEESTVGFLGIRKHVLTFDKLGVGRRTEW